jgi:hypothetical protein
MELRRERLTFEEMARVMNERHIPTARGGRWHPATVHRLFRRAAGIQRFEFVSYESALRKR